jgi:hypothetical protein
MVAVGQLGKDIEGSKWDVMQIQLAAAVLLRRKGQEDADDI